MKYLTKMLYDKETGTSITFLEEPVPFGSYGLYRAKVLVLGTNVTRNLTLTSAELRKRFVPFAKAASHMKIVKPKGAKDVTRSNQASHRGNDRPA